MTRELQPVGLRFSVCFAYFLITDTLSWGYFLCFSTYFCFIVVSVLVHTSTVSYLKRLVIEVTNSVQSRMLNGAQSVAVC